ncbi:hypothetical protein B0H19DRAFT_1104574 [Mycena capillaripes]|nr:hypothetical protein B0H19DRAFT_1104574 [Mycena capillaripes]
MLAALLPFVALFFVSQIARAQDGSSIPGLTEGQQECLADCLFVGIPAATNCPQYTNDPDVACFCSSAPFVANITQCTSTQCSICTGGGCNITADPLTDACGANATVTGSASNSGSASRTLSSSGSAPTSGSASGSASGSGNPTPSAPSSASPASVSSLQKATILTSALIFLGLAM